MKLEHPINQVAYRACEKKPLQSAAVMSLIAGVSQELGTSAHLKIPVVA